VNFKGKQAAFIGLWLAYWIVGFYPFHWSLPYIAYENAAAVALNGGWQFPKPGIVRTTAAPPWLSEAIRRSSVRITLEMRPAYYEQSGPARILTISQDPYLRNLTIAQEGKSLVLRLRTPETDLNGIPSYQIEDVFTKPEWQRVEVIIRPEAVEVAINHRMRLSHKLPLHPLSVWNPNYVLALGNELTFDRPWMGEIRTAHVSVGPTIFEYAHPNRMDISNPYSVPRTNCMVQVVPLSCSQSNQNRLLDWLINLAGFMPFGLFVARFFSSKRALRTAALASFGLSLSIELGQVFFARAVSLKRGSTFEYHWWCNRSSFCHCIFLFFATSIPKLIHTACPNPAPMLLDG
jgi:hypothetical protein